MTKRVLDRQDYKVGWICALPIELAAAQEILDEEHDHFNDKQGSTNKTASLYTLGRVGDHNVVLAGLPAGQLGTNSAAATAIQIQRDFPSIQFGLMVGIGGGVPSDANDIRLGDIVVSQPQMMHGGVIQYDLGKTRPDKFERTGFLNSPPTALLEAVTQLQARQFRSQDIFSKHISGFKHLPDFSRDYAGPDRLYQSSYSHVGGSDCDNCSDKYLIKRPIRKGLGIKVHQGTIASGNQVMRDGVERDRLSSDLGVLESLEFPEMYRRQIVIKRPCQGTGDWLFQTKEYQKWIRGTHRFLWIKGKAGAGKSVLMKRTLQELQIKSDGDPPTVASFFYDGSGTALEKSGTGLLRAILYQIFKQNRNLVEEFMTVSDDQFVKGPSSDWEIRELMEAFEISSKLQSWKLTVLLLDGLDEGFTEEARALVFFFKKQTFPGDSQNTNKLRICLSSRHYPSITMENCLELFVENHNHIDIETFTQQKLSTSSKNTNDEKMVRSILERADGVFLWADLVTSSILEADDNGETLQGKMAILNGTPRELGGLYTQVFLKLGSKERLDTFRMLSWVLMAARRLTPLELCFATQFSPSQSCLTFETWKRSSWFVGPGNQQERFIPSRSCGLLRIQKVSNGTDSHRVQFIH
ncbi:hypothetical protein IL306_000879 [Fusarium sp. DS 682]|nr:hypothetical protein IL306_000879 [Fusarium sp. DS 682]